MEPNQSFHAPYNFLGDFPSIFMNVVFIVILVYIVILVLNFFRDKFINKSTDSSNADILDLLTILNKLFIVSGFGFIIGDLVQIFLSGLFRTRSMNFNGNLDHLAFGIILIFMGLGFRAGRKLILANRRDSCCDVFSFRLQR